MRKITFLFIIVLMLSPLYLFAEHEEAEYCEIDPDGSYWDAWEKCEARLVRIKGKIAESAMQHPVGLHNTFDFNTKRIKEKHETYIDMNDFQIVVTSDQKIECTGNIEVEGIVDIIDLGGEAGKSSYKNVWIKAQNYECK